MIKTPRLSATLTPKENGATCFQVAPPSFGDSIMDHLLLESQDPKHDPGYFPQTDPRPPREKTPGTAQIGGLGTNGNLSHPPHDDLYLMAFRLLKPTHRLYCDDFNSKAPILKHSDKGRFPHRSAFCYERVVPGMIGAELRRSLSDDHKVGIAGTIRCRSIHLCPVCSLAAALNWQEDVIACEEQLRSDGHRLLLVVLTVYHERKDSLQHVMDLVRAGYEELFSNRKKNQKKRSEHLGIVGRLRSWDILYSEEHGWHAHMNVMLCVDNNDLTVEDILARLRLAYLRAIQKAGGFASISNGIKVTEYKNGKSYSVKTGMEGLSISRIGAKWTLAHEVVSPGGKRQSGMTIGQLRAIAAGMIKDHRLSSAEAARLCLEYGATMSGERMVITAGIVRSVMRAIRRCPGDKEDSEMLSVDYTIDAVIISEEYWSKIVIHNRYAELVEKMRDGKRELLNYLQDIGVTVDPRNISLQLSAYDSLTYDRDRHNAGAVSNLREQLEHHIILDEYNDLIL